MTRTISLIIGIAAVALAVAVPTAFGEGRLAGSQEQSAVEFFKANEMATLTQSGVQPVLGVYKDANERGSVQSSGNESVLSGYVDANERGTATQTIAPEPSSYRDGGERATVPSSPVTVAAVDSGREIEWPQLGIGFGVGIVLALGLLLAMRFTRIRPLAH
jgi:hypothetical protein